MMGSDKLTEKQMILIGVLTVIFIVFLVIVNLLDNKSLNGIKSKKSVTGNMELLVGHRPVRSKRLLFLCHLSLRNGVKAWICRPFRVRW